MVQACLEPVKGLPLPAAILNLKFYLWKNLPFGAILQPLPLVRLRIAEC